MVFTNQLIKRIQFHYVESNKLTLKSANTPTIDYLLLWTHVVKSSQVYYVTHLNKVNERVHQPTRTNLTG